MKLVGRVARIQKILNLKSLSYVSVLDGNIEVDLTETVVGKDIFDPNSRLLCTR